MTRYRGDTHSSTMTRKHSNKTVYLGKFDRWIVSNGPKLKKSNCVITTRVKEAINFPSIQEAEVNVSQPQPPPPLREVISQFGFVTWDEKLVSKETSRTLQETNDQEDRIRKGWRWWWCHDLPSILTTSESGLIKRQNKAANHSLALKDCLSFWVHHSYLSASLVVSDRHPLSLSVRDMFTL